MKLKIIELKGLDKSYNWVIKSFTDSGTYEGIKGNYTIERVWLNSLRIFAR